ESVADYAAFLWRKTQMGADHGFDPLWMPEQVFDFQRALIGWSLRKGRAMVNADTGLGKTLMELAWAHNVAMKTGKPVLILTPLAVAPQTVREAHKFGIEAHHAARGLASSGINVTNYERLHLFDPDDFGGVVCDESSILKSYMGATRKAITRFVSKIPYRLLATATAAPNDWTELGTSSEALGELTHSDMLKRFFAQLDDKGQKREQARQDDAEKAIAADPSYYLKLSYRVSQTIGQYRLKHHAVDHFWRWVASWARACRLPSDLGFDDGNFLLPSLIETDHIISPDTPRDGYLFNLPAFGLSEEREERKRTLVQRCEFAASLVDHDRPAVIWCQMNDEGDLLEKLIPDAAQIAGRTPDDRKIELYEAFANGDLRVMIIKPKIGAWGLNWQHCNHVVTFATHSFEQYYQSVRRCWRFGQTRPVQLDVIATEGEERVLANMRNKGRKAELMFSRMVAEMNNALSIQREERNTKKMEVPAWL
ncbi:MAG: DEAD/DEAH box helicase, partial [Gammaproteobacteria bacterium]|nr:DEAD/DEAH box helicase [Gammaproteobacteria bacterium]